MRNILLIIIIMGLSKISYAGTSDKKLTIKDGSASIHYIDEGTGDTTLLFLHGWSINGAYWKSQIDHFSAKYRVLAPDLPGFGQSTSTRTDWTVEAYGTDVIEFIEKLNLKHVILIGHSMSGDVILEAGLKNHPSVIGLIGIDNFKMVDIPFTPEQANEIENFKKMLESDYVNTAKNYADMMLFHPSTSIDVKERVKTDFAGTNPVTGTSTLNHVIDYSPKEAQKLRELNYKLVLLNSDAIPTNVEGLKNNCKSSFEIVEIHATGHYPMIEKPETFNKLLESAIDKIINR